MEASKAVLVTYKQEELLMKRGPTLKETLFTAIGDFGLPLPALNYGLKYQDHLLGPSFWDLLPQDLIPHLTLVRKNVPAAPAPAPSRPITAEAQVQTEEIPAKENAPVSTTIPSVALNNETVSPSQAAPPPVASTSQCQDTAANRQKQAKLDTVRMCMPCGKMCPTFFCPGCTVTIRS